LYNTVAPERISLDEMFGLLTEEAILFQDISLHTMQFQWLYLATHHTAFILVLSHCPTKTCMVGRKTRYSRRSPCIPAVSVPHRYGHSPHSALEHHHLWSARPDCLPLARLTCCFKGPTLETGCYVLNYLHAKQLLHQHYYTAENLSHRLCYCSEDF
jgi:hypothetical protein